MLMGGLASLTLCLGGGLLIVALGNGPLASDVAWQEFENLHQSPLFTALSLRQ